MAVSGTNLGDRNVFDVNKLRDYVLFLAPDNGNGGGGSSGGPSGNQNPPADPPVVDDNEEEDDEQDDADDDDTDDDDSSLDKDDPAKAFEKLLARFGGDATRAAEQLFREARNHRASKRLLRDQVSELKRGQPRKGSVLLQKGPARQYRDFQALNMTPAQIRASLQELDSLRTSNAETGKRARLEKVAGAAKFNVDALQQLGGDLEYDVQEVTVNGQTTSSASVVKRTKSANGSVEVTRIPIEQYAKDNWSVFMPALQTVENGGGASRTNGQSTGRFVRQAPGNTTAHTQTGQGSGGYGGKYLSSRRKPETNKK